MNFEIIPVQENFLAKVWPNLGSRSLILAQYWLVPQLFLGPSQDCPTSISWAKLSCQYWAKLGCQYWAKLLAELVFIVIFSIEFNNNNNQSFNNNNDKFFSQVFC